VIEDLKEERDTEYTSKNMPWGYGSFIHSLVDLVFMFSKDENLNDKLKEIFVNRDIS
jgi:hypothetical protein